MIQELKYMKLFEAFESIKLAKTLNFIKGDDRIVFKSWLEKIASKIDFPLSKYNDDLFQYLPFKRALELYSTKEIESTVCKAKSMDSFRSTYGVKDEICQGGKIKRKWGSGVRTVDCPECGGTGKISVPVKYNIKWIKFWFDKDGKYINTTAVDGKKRAQQHGTGGVTSDDINDYIRVRNIDGMTDVRNLKTGDILLINISHGDVIGTVWKSSNGNIYVIQNKFSGSNDDYSQEWKKYGSCSWVLSSRSDYQGTPVLLSPKRKESEVDKDEQDPFEYNTMLQSNITVSNSSDMRNKLSGAHFALVLDYEGLSELKYTKRTEIISNRAEGRLNSERLKSNDTIKSENLARYFDKISDSITLSQDLSDISKPIIRLLGSGLAGIYLMRSRQITKLHQIIHYIYSALLNEDEQDIEYYMELAIKTFKSCVKENLSFNQAAMKSFNKIDKFISDNNLVDGKFCMDKLHEINRHISNKIKESPMETLEDLEVLLIKCKSISDTFRNLERNQPLRQSLQGICDNIDNPSIVTRYIRTTMSDENKRSIDSFIKIIEKI